MKKLLVLCMMFLGAVGLEAQNITGSWVTILEENGANVAVLFGFDDNSNSIMKTIFEIHDQDMGVINLELTVEGTYQVNGKKLKLNPDKKTAEVSIGDVEWTEQMKAKFKKNPDLEKSTRKILKDKFEEQKAAFVDELVSETDMTIVSMSSTDLVLKSEDDVMRFKRFNAN